jgi:hypothetical protein
MWSWRLREAIECGTYYRKQDHPFLTLMIGKFQSTILTSEQIVNPITYPAFLFGDHLMDSNSMWMLLAGPPSQLFVKQINLLGLTCGCGTCLNSETSNYEIAQCW